MKKIEDYLHLYYMVDCHPINGKFEPVTIHSIINPGMRDVALRPLSDMTEEEKREFIKVAQIEPEDIECVEQSDNEITGLMYGTAHLTNALQWAQGTKYLLSRGFDLFNLIEENIAIDKTKIK